MVMIENPINMYVFNFENLSFSDRILLAIVLSFDYYLSFY